jgi:hypothetical protein
MRRNEDRYAVVVVAAPVAGEVPGAFPGDDGSGFHRLVVDDLAVRGAGPIRVDPVTIAGVVATAVDVAEPVHQAHPVEAGRILGVVVGSGDEPVQGHRHVQGHSRHAVPSSSMPSKLVGTNPSTLEQSAQPASPSCLGFGTPIGYITNL